MPFTSNVKINSLKTMLIKYFPDKQPVSITRIKQVAEEDIIAVALTEKFIREVSKNGEKLFEITTDGEQYRDLRQ